MSFDFRDVDITKLSAFHSTDGFDCGSEALNRYLDRQALVNNKAGIAQTYVAVRANGVVLGFYSLTFGSIEQGAAPAGLIKDLSRYPIPVVLLARMAVDETCHGRGLGAALLKDAILRSLQAADIVGISVLLVHAKDGAARRWYERFGFEPSPTDPLHLFVLIKDLRALAG
jgi:GNAT superfamily N-acetyltransferase